MFLISWMFRYDATIEALTPNGYFVSYDEWGNKEEVRLTWLNYVVLKPERGLLFFNIYVHYFY